MVQQNTFYIFDNLDLVYIFQNQRLNSIYKSLYDDY